MVEPSSAILYGAGALAITETTGITSFTGLSGSGGENESPSLPSMGGGVQLPDMSGIAGAFAGELGNVSQAGFGATTDVASIMADLQTQQAEMFERVQSGQMSPEQIIDLVETTTPDVPEGGDFGQQSPLWAMLNADNGGINIDWPGGNGGGNGGNGAGSGGGAPSVYELLTTQEARSGLPSPGAWVGNVPGRVTDPVFESFEGAMSAGGEAWESDKDRLDQVAENFRQQSEREAGYKLAGFGGGPTYDEIGSGVQSVVDRFQGNGQDTDGTTEHSSGSVLEREVDLSSDRKLHRADEEKRDNPTTDRTGIR